MSEKNIPEKASCLNPDCTVVETGHCLLGHENYTSECPHYRLQPEQEMIDAEVPVSLPTDEETAAIKRDQTQSRRFWSGSELGLKAVFSIMRARYAYLIGLVGPTGVGKTCFLNSLYLKASSSSEPLEQYRFAGSLSLPGFEERVKFARTWREGQIPETLSMRTLLQDSRQPGFMHLRLAEIDSGEASYEMLLTDLPGEWFEKMISNVNNAERLMFLQRADGILFFADAERLLNTDTRHQEVHQAKLLLERLAKTVQLPREIPFTIVISKVDVINSEFSDTTSIFGTDELINSAQAQGFTPELIYTASFSRCPDLIPSSFGVESAMSSILRYRSAVPTVDYHLIPSPSVDRSFIRFRGTDMEDD